MSEADKQFVITDAQRVGLGRGFSFEAGHQLTGYDGKCATPHGHSYHGRAMVSIPRAHADANGILLDFDVLKRAIHENIFRVYDHRTIVDRTAEQLVHEMATAMQSWFTANGGTTMNIQHEDIGLKSRTCPPDVRVERVVLYETANCFAEWRRGGF